MGLFRAVDVLLVVENGIKDRICHAIHGYVQANKKKMNIYEPKN